MRSERAGFEFVEVFGRVDAEDVVVRCGSRRDEIGWSREFLRDKRVAHQAVFLRRENVRAEVKVVFEMIDERKRRHAR